VILAEFDAPELKTFYRFLVVIGAISFKFSLRQCPSGINIRSGRSGYCTWGRHCNHILTYDILQIYFIAICAEHAAM
jgi:hypothetical protein